jgi:hypothetical protein
LYFAERHDLDVVGVNVVCEGCGGSFEGGRDDILEDLVGWYDAFDGR